MRTASCHPTSPSPPIEINLVPGGGNLRRLPVTPRPRATPSTSAFDIRQIATDARDADVVYGE